MEEAKVNNTQEVYEDPNNQTNKEDIQEHSTYHDSSEDKHSFKFLLLFILVALAYCLIILLLGIAFYAYKQVKDDNSQSSGNTVFVETEFGDLQKDLDALNGLARISGRIER
jgi:uncharacterized membrane protein YukC